MGISFLSSLLSSSFQSANTIAKMSTSELSPVKSANNKVAVVRDELYSLDTFSIADGQGCR